MRKLKVTELHRISREEFKKAPKTPLIVVLDNIRSVQNVGSVFRTSDAFRIEKILLCGITAQPPQANLHKTALGAEDSVEWEYFARTEDAVKKLKEEGVHVYAVEQAEGSILLDRFEIKEPDGRYAAVFGNEVTGVGQSVVDLCKACIEIPQFGTKHSLNISVSAGIVLWDLFRKINKDRPFGRSLSMKTIIDEDN